MFIELHNTAGEPFLVNVDLIFSVGKKEDGGSVVYSEMLGVDVVPQESYEEICNALRSLIITAKADGNGILEIWKRFVQCKEPTKIDLAFDTSKGPGD